ncbi:hypothetical protein AAF712_003948 [Marasmius tenuissimus]|uniref:Uncharacterized protein n=1 Tax=Marasmius tenuissimus TaxID=585030 RepID=A0ABR3A4R3_9AGAR
MSEDESSVPTANAPKISLSFYGRRIHFPRYNAIDSSRQRGNEQNLEVCERADSTTTNITNAQQPTQSTGKRRRGVEDTAVGSEPKRLRLARDDSPPQEHTPMENQPLPPTIIHLPEPFVFDFDIPLPDLESLLASECEHDQAPCQTDFVLCENPTPSIFAPTASFSPLEVTSLAEVTLSTSVTESITMISCGVDPVGAESGHNIPGDISVNSKDTEHENVEGMDVEQREIRNRYEQSFELERAEASSTKEHVEEKDRNNAYEQGFKGDVTDDRGQDISETYGPDVGSDEDWQGSGEVYGEVEEEIGPGQRGSDEFYDHGFEVNVIDDREQGTLEIYVPDFGLHEEGMVMDGEGSGEIHGEVESHDEYFQGHRAGADEQCNPEVYYDHAGYASEGTSFEEQLQEVLGGKYVGVHGQEVEGGDVSQGTVDRREDISVEVEKQSNSRLDELIEERDSQELEENEGRETIIEPQSLNPYGWEGFEEGFMDPGEEIGGDGCYDEVVDTRVGERSSSNGYAWEAFEEAMGPEEEMRNDGSYEKQDRDGDMDADCRSLRGDFDEEVMDVEEGIVGDGYYEEVVDTRVEERLLSNGYAWEAFEEAMCLEEEMRNDGSYEQQDGDGDVVADGRSLRGDFDEGVLDVEEGIGGDGYYEEVADVRVVQLSKSRFDELIKERYSSELEEDENGGRQMIIEPQLFSNAYSWEGLEEGDMDVEEDIGGDGCYDEIVDTRVGEQSFSNGYTWEVFEEATGPEEIRNDGKHEQQDRDGDMVAEGRSFMGGFEEAAAGPEELWEETHMIAEEQPASDQVDGEVVYDGDIVVEEQGSDIFDQVDTKDQGREELVNDEPVADMGSVGDEHMNSEEQQESGFVGPGVSDASMDVDEQFKTEPKFDGGQTSHTSAQAKSFESLGDQGANHLSKRLSPRADPQPSPRGKATNTQSIPDGPHESSGAKDRSRETSRVNDSDATNGDEEEESLRTLLVNLIPLISNQKHQAELLGAMNKKDCDLYALIGRASVILNIAPDRKAGPIFDRDGFQKIKRRAQTTLDLARHVRREVNALTQPKGAPLTTITSEQRKEWQRTRFTCGGPTVANFVLDLTSVELWKDNQWNQQASAIFTEWFVNQQGYGSYKKLDVANAFKTHLRSIKKQFIQKNSPTSNHKEVHTTDRRTMRKRNHRGRRVAAIRTFAKSYPAMEPFLESVKRLTVDMMSGEETELDKKGKSPKKHRALFQRWRSEEFTEFLRLLDALHISTRFLEGTRKYSPGQFPCWRTPSTKPDCDYFPVGLPENWYSKEFLDEEPGRRQHLKVGAPVPLRLPDNVLRCAIHYVYC